MARYSTLFSLPILGLLVGCPEVATQDTDDTDPVFIDAAIVGTWVSEGADLAPVFVGQLTRIDATFEDDGTYSVTTDDGAGQMFTLTGTYSVDTATDPASITLEQDIPAFTFNGIWAVDASGVMQYEVVAEGLGTAPTPTTGFGSSVGTYDDGTPFEPGDNIQTYR